MTSAELLMSALPHLNQEQRIDRMRADRLHSLDVFRGISIVAMIIVNTAMVMAAVDGAETYTVLKHAPWAGVTLADLVFPAFLFILGVAIPIAHRGPEAAHRFDKLIVARIFKRAFLLFLIGLGLNLVTMFRIDAETIRIMGVLQRIAVVYLFAALIYLRVDWRACLAIAVGLLMLYWPLAYMGAPGIGGDVMVPGDNLIAWFDRLILGQHIYITGAKGFDPEGLLSSLPAIAQALLGVLAGIWLKSTSGLRQVGWLTLTGIGMTLGGLVWGMEFPMIKALWTSSYVMFTTGLALIALAGLAWILDIRKSAHWWNAPLDTFGRNAITAYVLHLLLLWGLARNVLAAIYWWAAGQVSPELASLAPVTALLLMTWGAIAMLERGNIRISL